MRPFTRGIWQEDEHQRFLDSLKRHPDGPWGEIARCVGTRSARQVQTHAQKYYEKIERHLRGLQRDRKGSRQSGVRGSGGTTREHEIDQEILVACSRALQMGERLPTPAKPRGTSSPGTEGSFQVGPSGRSQQECGSAEVEEEEEEEEGGGDDANGLLSLEKSLDFLIELYGGVESTNQCARRWHRLTPSGSHPNQQHPHA